jgi:arylsulfatase A-like enzyme
MSLVSRIRFFMFAAGLSSAPLPWTAIPAPAAQPNVVIFYADDLGWGETGAQGNKDIPTPHIDSLASSGVRFTQGYVAATYCSPSRAGLMTGRYPTRFGHEFNGIARHSGLSLKETTLATRLKALGYATACVGKWHLGESSPEYYPTNRGFDEFYGTLANTPFFHPTQFIDSLKSPAIQEIKDDGLYTTDAYAERAVDWLERNKDKPWFLYLPFNAQHAPLQAPQKYLERFPGITDAKRKLFAAMMSAMDDAVGRVMAKVRELKQEENTLVFYIGDNGGPTQSTTSQNGGLRGFKMTTFEGGPRVPFFLQWKGTLPVGKVEDRPAMNLDVAPTVLAAAGAKIDPEWKFDGVDLLPYLSGKQDGRPHETMFWRFGDQWAVRDGDWKLVVSRDRPDGVTPDKPQLYDLANDRNESNNLAAAQPEQVARLQKLYDRWNAEQAAPTVADAPRRTGARGEGTKPNRGKKAVR